MKTKLFNLVMVLMIVLTALGANAQPAYAEKEMRRASACQCVVYIKNKFHLSGSAGYAKNMGTFLKARGFWKLTTPRPNEIIIMKPAFEHGVDSTAGHVGLIHSVSVITKKEEKFWRVTVRGASQRGSKWTESNCNNVTFWTVEYSQDWKDKYVEYWVKGTK